MLDRLEQGMESDRQKNIKFGNALKKAFQEDVVIPTISSVIPILGGLAMSDGGLKGVKILPTIANIMASQARKQVLPAVLGATVYEDAYNKNKDKSRWFNFTDSNDKTYGEKAATFLKGLALNSGIQAANLATQAATDKLLKPVSKKIGYKIEKEAAERLDAADGIKPSDTNGRAERLANTFLDRFVDKKPMDLLDFWKKYGTTFIGNNPYILQPTTEPYNIKELVSKGELPLGQLIGNRFDVAYPKLAKNIVVRMSHDLPDDTLGVANVDMGEGELKLNANAYVNPKTKELYPGKEKEITETTGHETNHAISDYVGDTGGGSSDDASRVLGRYGTSINDAFDMLFDLQPNKRDDLSQIVQYTNDLAEIKDKLRDMEIDPHLNTDTVLQQQYQRRKKNFTFTKNERQKHFTDLNPELINKAIRLGSHIYNYNSLREMLNNGHARGELDEALARSYIYRLFGDELTSRMMGRWAVDTQGLTIPKGKRIQDILPAPPTITNTDYWNGFSRNIPIDQYGHIKTHQLLNVDTPQTNPGFFNRHGYSDGDGDILFLKLKNIEQNLDKIFTKNRKK